MRVKKKTVAHNAGSIHSRGMQSARLSDKLPACRGRGSQPTGSPAETSTSWQLVEHFPRMNRPWSRRTRHVRSWRHLLLAVVTGVVAAGVVDWLLFPERAILLALLRSPKTKM